MVLAVDVPVTMQLEYQQSKLVREPGGASVSVHRQTAGHSSCDTEKGTCSAKLCRKPSRFHGCSSWDGCRRARCYATTGAWWSSPVSNRPSPFITPVSPGPGSDVRNMFGWSQLGKTARLGVWWFWGALKGENVFSLLAAAGDWVKKGSYHIAWSVPSLSSCSCSYSYGQGQLSGNELAGVGHCLLDCGGLSHTW